MGGLCTECAYMHFERRYGERARRGRPRCGGADARQDGKGREGGDRASAIQRPSEGPGLLLAQLLVTLSTQQGAERVEQTAAFRGRPTMREPMRALLWSSTDPLVAGACWVAYGRVPAHS